MSQKRYEYKIIDPELWRSGDVARIEQELNRLGREGWEIVGVVGNDAVGTSNWQRNVVAVRIAILASAVDPVSNDTSDTGSASFVLLDADPVAAIKKNFPAPSGPLTLVRARVFTTTISLRNRGI